MKVTVKVDGLRELDAALGQLPKATAKAVLRRVAVKALQPFDRRWRQIAEAHKLTGSYVTSGGVGTKLTKRQARLNRKRDDKSFAEVFAGPNDPSAVPGEFGTHDQRARPSVRPAWDAEKDGALTSVKGQLGAAIEKAAARLAKRNAKKG